MRTYEYCTYFCLCVYLAFVNIHSLNAADNAIFAFEETIYGLCGRQPTDYCRQASSVIYFFNSCMYVVTEILVRSVYCKYMYVDINFNFI